MERTAPRPLEDLSPRELETLWEQAKKKLANRDAPGRDDPTREAKQAARP